MVCMCLVLLPICEALDYASGPAQSTRVSMSVFLALSVSVLKSRQTAVGMISRMGRERRVISGNRISLFSKEFQTGRYWIMAASFWICVSGGMGIIIYIAFSGFQPINQSAHAEAEEDGCEVEFHVFGCGANYGRCGIDRRL